MIITDKQSTVMHFKQSTVMHFKHFFDVCFFCLQKNVCKFIPVWEGG